MALQMVDARRGLVGAFNINRLFDNLLSLYLLHRVEKISANVAFPMTRRYISGMENYRFYPGRLPLLVNVPHAGTAIPDNIASRMRAAGRASVDSDRHVDRLYDFARRNGACMLVANWSRYVVDLNRGANDENLYPGQDTTGVCPLNSFDHVALYQAGKEPDAPEIAQRIKDYWWPYHEKIMQELSRLRADYGYALLWDAHSIKSQVPRFFKGRLPDINLGTADGRSCASGLGEELLEETVNWPELSAVLNGRFKGGYITRHYGRPAHNIHAIQLELSQITYMQENPPFDYLPERATALQPRLEALLKIFLQKFKSRAQF